MGQSRQPDRGSVPDDDQNQPPMHGGSAPPRAVAEDTDRLTHRSEAQREAGDATGDAEPG